jgi:hypothetical protein
MFRGGRIATRIRPDKEEATRNIKRPPRRVKETPAETVVELGTGPRGRRRRRERPKHAIDRKRAALAAAGVRWCPTLRRTLGAFASILAPGPFGCAGTGTAERGAAREPCQRVSYSGQPVNAEFYATEADCERAGEGSRSRPVGGQLQSVSARFVYSCAPSRLGTLLAREAADIPVHRSL